MHPRLFTVVAVLALAGCVAENPKDPLQPGPGTPTDQFNQTSEPLQVHEEFDLVGGLDWERSWNVTAPTSGFLRIVWTGPEGLHGPGSICQLYRLYEEREGSWSRRETNQCSSGGASLQAGSGNLAPEVLMDHDFAGVLYGEYFVHLSSEPQVGRITVDIVVEV